jgi:hypothetical protein
MFDAHLHRFTLGTRVLLLIKILYAQKANLTLPINKQGFQPILIPYNIIPKTLFEQGNNLNPSPNHSMKAQKNLNNGKATWLKNEITTKYLEYLKTQQKTK